jgi:ABC-type amino acid transport substrate-binding protein
MRGLAPLALSAFVVSAFSLVAGDTVAGPVLDRINRTGKIVITNRDASAPFSYLDKEKKPVGYSVDVCMRLAAAIRRELKRPDIKVNFYPVTSASRIPAIVEGKADLECGSTTNNAERRKFVDFTIPYFIAGARMVVRANSGIRNWSDLGGKIVVTTKGTTNAKSIQERNDVRSLNIKLIEADDHADSFRMVENEQADAFAMDDVLLYALRAHSASPSGLAVVGDLLTVEPYAVMFSKDDAELKRIVDLEIAEMIYAGDIHKLYARWFQSPIPPKGANLQMPMGHLLASSLRYPSDKVAD